MVFSKQWREQLDKSKKHIHFEPERDAYSLTEIFKRVKISGLEAANKFFEVTASSMTKFLAAHKDLKTVKKSSEAEQIEAANTYMIAMNQLLDHAVVKVAQMSED
ncbi:MAG: hypothetical protein LQ347_005176, partial [Umbilicaria vellea]